MTVVSESSEALGLDPRTKLILIACLSTMAVLLRHLAFLAGVLLISLLLLSAFRVSITSVWKRAQALFAIVMFIALLQSLFGQGGKALITAGSLNLLTTGGLLLAGEFILRMLIILASAGILTTCGSREVIQGLVQWKLPYEVAFMAALGLRFLPVFGEEFRDAMTAIQLRGIDMKALNLKQRIRIYAGMLQPVVAGALLKSRDLSLSIEMRGFRAFPRRVSYRRLRLKVGDYAVMAAAGFLTATILISYFAWVW